MALSRQQVVVLPTLYLCYALYVYVRRSFSFAMPTVSRTANLDKSQLGMILSSQALAYAISKFTCGLLVDVVSPNVMLSGGLILSGVTAICFTVSESVVMMSGLWFLNGLAQGPGWPAIAVILKQSCAADQFGTAWSVVSTSMNVAGMIGPLLTTVLIAQTSWQSCIQLAGLVSIVFGCVAFMLMQNKAEPDDSNTRTKTQKNINTSAGEDTWKLLFLPGFLGLCVCQLVQSIIQYGTLQWTQLYMVQERGLTPISGSAFISSEELGGVAGSFVVGVLSDVLITKNPTIARHLMRQVLVVFFTLFQAAVLYWITYGLSPDTSQLTITVMGFCAGFGIYGPVAIFGVVAMESGPEHKAGTLHAILGLFSNAGVFISGLPLSYVAKVYDWETVFLIQSTLITMTFLYLLIKLRTILPSVKYKLL